MYNTLKQYFGFENFLPLQKEIITDVLNKKDVLALLPTGGGKSLCYQLPALKLPGITLVISPLIALMKDQVQALHENKIPAAYLNSSLKVKEERQIKEDVVNGKIKLLYVAPERLMKEGFLEFITEQPVSLIAVDEAHCISEWGHDFRPEYRSLSVVRGRFPGVPVIALTATATKKVREDIVRQLEFKDHATYCGSFDRKNLRYVIRDKQNGYYHILHYIEDRPGQSGIMYCQSRNSVERMAAELTADGIHALPYHAGLPQNTRTEHQDKFKRGEAQVIVATIAFGMGIDKPDVRFVMHYDLPKNLEGYYQETGRAGRDGLPADCILFFSYADKRKHEFFIEQTANPLRAAIMQQQLDTMMTFCTATRCRRKMLLSYFSETYPHANCKACDVCME